MEVWQIWVAVALVFFIIEIFTSGFAVACFSFGAVAAAVAAACSMSLLWQLIFFAAVSILALIFVRPLIVKLFYRKDDSQDKKTNADAVIGRTARVTRTIDGEGKGRVAIDGDDWKAVGENDSTVIHEGSKVEVIGRDSIVLKVKQIQ